MKSTMPDNNDVQPPIRAVPMTLFPVMGSLQEVVNYGISKLPISGNNELVTLLLTYHNTLLKQLNEPTKEQ